MVSIGIPFYNNKNTILDAIRSVFAQSYRDWELILVDDGASDGSYEIAGSIRDDRVRFLSDGAHRGLIYRLNQIIRESKGEFIARMDADDLMHPERIITQLRYLESHPGIDVLGSAMYSVGKDLLPEGERSASMERVSVFNRFNRGFFIHVSVMGKREWFKNNLYREGFLRAEDQELWLRTYRGSVFANLPEPLMYVRELESLSFKKYAQSSKSMRKIYWLYGPPEVGMIKSWLLILQSYFKVLFYFIGIRLGFERVLLSLRNSYLSPGQVECASLGIKNVLETQVPLKNNE